MPRDPGDPPKLAALLPPATRAECADLPRPCPRLRCRYHLWVEVARRSPKTRLEDMEQTCALDVADAAGPEGETLEKVGELLNLTRERVRQLEVFAIKKLQRRTAPDVWLLFPYPVS